MAEYFRKTDAGRRELRERRLDLPRVARNLLLIIDGTRSVRDWVGMIQGASLQDAAALLDLGLIEEGRGRPAGDSELAGLAPTGPATLSGALPTLPAAWTRPGRLSELGGLPSPGAQPRHAAALGGDLPTLPVALETQPAGLGEAGSWRLSHHALADGAPEGALPASARPASGRHGAAAQDEDAPSTLPGEWDSGAAGFVPLDAGAAGRSGLSHAELHARLSALVRETLGLLKGYRYTLRIERAGSLLELEAVAMAFVVEVRRLRGDAMARRVERALGLAQG